MPRLISASASSFSHLPSCTTKLTHSPLGNQQSATESKSESDKGSLKLWIEIWNASQDHFTRALSLDRLSDAMPNYLQTSQISQVYPTKTNKNKLNSLTHFFWVLGFLEIIDLVWNQSRQKAKWKEKAENFVNNLQCSKAGVADIQQVRLDLKWIGVGFLDLAVFLRGFWKAGATSNINSWWKHPI